MEDSLNKKISIRLANELDVEQIKYIIKQSFVDYCNVIGIDTVEALEEGEKEILHDITKKFVYVACLEDLIIGSVRVDIKGGRTFVSRFATLPEYQSLGVGSELLSYVENVLANANVSVIDLYSAVDNVKLKDFYISKGYTIVSIDDKKGYKRGLFQKEIH